MKQRKPQAKFGRDAGKPGAKRSAEIADNYDGGRDDGGAKPTPITRARRAKAAHVSNDKSITGRVSALRPKSRK